MKIYLSEHIKKSNDILNDILINDFKLANYEIYKNQYGKKYLKDLKIFFNISHSNGLIALAFDGEECGIDIEFLSIDRRFESLVKHYFNDSEKQEYLNTIDKIDCFYHIWTAKEAYSKMIGTGIIGYFNNLPLDYDKYIKRYNVYLNDKKFKLAICTKAKNIEFVLDNNIILEENNE